MTARFPEEVKREREHDINRQQLHAFEPVGFGVTGDLARHNPGQHDDQLFGGSERKVDRMRSQK